MSTEISAITNVNVTSSVSELQKTSSNVLNTIKNKLQEGMNWLVKNSRSLGTMGQVAGAAGVVAGGLALIVSGIGANLSIGGIPLGIPLLVAGSALFIGGSAFTLFSAIKNVNNHSKGDVIKDFFKRTVVNTAIGSIGGGIIAGACAFQPLETLWGGVLTGVAWLKDNGSKILPTLQKVFSTVDKMNNTVFGNMDGEDKVDSQNKMTEAKDQKPQEVSEKEKSTTSVESSVTKNSNAACENMAGAVVASAIGDK